MTAAPRFTPGPWRIDDNAIYEQHDGYHGIDAARGCFSIGGEGEHDTGFSLSGYLSIDNARLIAAAPDLYEALDRIITEAGEGSAKGRAIDLLSRRAVDAAYAALAKVTP